VTASSGALVPKATTVRPTTSGEIPAATARREAPRTSSSAPPDEGRAAEHEQDHRVGEHLGSRLENVLGRTVVRTEGLPPGTGLRADPAWHRVLRNRPDDADESRYSPSQWTLPGLSWTACRCAVDSPSRGGSDRNEATGSGSVRCDLARRGRTREVDLGVGLRAPRPPRERTSLKARRHRRGCVPSPPQRREVRSAILVDSEHGNRRAQQYVP
jgi:hypothetical protein